MHVIAPGRGFPSSRITTIMEDRSGHLWLGIGTTVLRAAAEHLVKAALDASLPLEFSLFDDTDGLRTGELALGLQPASAVDPAGRIWFATMRGAARIDPAAMPAPGPPPRLVIETVSHLPMQSTEHGPDGKLRPAVRESRSGPFDAGVVLPPGSRRVEIDYALLDFSAPGKQRFQVRLKGRDDEWTDMGNRRTFYVDDLTPGHYSVEVRGVGGDGAWSAEATTTALTLEPRFYQTSLFRLGSGGIILLLTVLIVRRDSRLRWKHEREQLAQKSRLAESQLRLALILENTGDFVAFATPDHRLLYVNLAGRRLIGLAGDADVSTLNWPALLPPWAEKLVLTEGLSTALRTGSWQGDTALRHGGGGEIPVSQLLMTHRDD